MCFPHSGGFLESPSLGAHPGGHAGTSFLEGVLRGLLDSAGGKVLERIFQRCLPEILRTGSKKEKEVFRKFPEGNSTRFWRVRP